MSWCLKIIHIPVEMPVAMKVMRAERRAKKAMGIETRRE